MEIASIVASFVSLILAGVAIWQAMYFYTQGKNTEAKVDTALEGIRAQTDALQALNARTLDRLTKYVTTPRNDTTQSAQVLADAVRELPNIVLSLRMPAPNVQDDSLRREIVHAYIALWNYTATANVWASYCLPLFDNFDENNPNDILAKTIVDRSAADFNYMTEIIYHVPASELKATSYFHLYEEVQRHLLNRVGDSTHHFARFSRNV